jgi:formylglycine-generating enzyme required for sulfatase activity
MKKHLTLTLAAALAAACLLTQCADLAGLPSAPPDLALLSASKEAPFVNSLGMKFVPVPGTSVLFCTTETTVAQYQAAGLGYKAPQFPQSSNHPAVGVSWNDAKAWCAWMSQREGKKYRIPTDAEWSAALGTSSTYPWGESWPPPNNYGNYMGQEAAVAEMKASLKAYGLSSVNIIAGYRDRHVFTAPVGSYAANRLGVYDISDNVWEWCEDRHPTWADTRVLRGSSWFNCEREYLASCYRLSRTPDYRNFYIGFRCVVLR